MYFLNPMHEIEYNRYIHVYIRIYTIDFFYMYIYLDICILYSCLQKKIY